MKPDLIKNHIDTNRHETCFGDTQNPVRVQRINNRSHPWRTPMTRMTGLFRIVAAVLCLTLGNANAADDAPPHPSPEAANDHPNQPSTKEETHNTSSTTKKNKTTHEEPECD